MADNTINPNRIVAQPPVDGTTAESASAPADQRVNQDVAEAGIEAVRAAMAEIVDYADRAKDPAPPRAGDNQFSPLGGSAFRKGEGGVATMRSGTVDSFLRQGTEGAYFECRSEIRPGDADGPESILCSHQLEPGDNPWPEVELCAHIVPLPEGVDEGELEGIRRWLRPDPDVMQCRADWKPGDPKPDVFKCISEWRPENGRDDSIMQCASIIPPDEGIRGSLEDFLEALPAEPQPNVEEFGEYLRDYLGTDGDAMAKPLFDSLNKWVD